MTTPLSTVLPAARRFSPLRIQTQHGAAVAAAAIF